MDHFMAITATFAEHRDPEKARGMAHYMRDQFLFYGVQATQRRQLSRPWLKIERKQPIDWRLIDQCFAAAERELQYFACDYLRRRTCYLTYEDLPHIKTLLMTKSWWDTVDSLVKVLGQMALADPRVATMMVTWGTDPNLWVRRAAIEHQLGLKDRTNQVRLATIITANLGQDEFFINKAIGWALREYSKTDSDWVRNYLAEYQGQLAPLSVREASKYL